MNDNIYKPPESDLLTKNSIQEQIKKPYILLLIQIVTWTFLLRHFVAFGKLNQPDITQPMMIGIVFISTSVMAFSFFILATISDKHLNMVKRIRLYLFWMLFIFFLMGFFRVYGLYSPNIEINVNQAHVFATFEILRVFIPLLLIIWVSKSKKVTHYIEQENRPPSLS